MFMISGNHSGEGAFVLCPSFDPHGDHIQTCQRHSAALPAHEWIVYKLRSLFLSGGHRVKIHKVTLDVCIEHGDIEIKDYVILPNGEDNRIPPLTLMMDVTVTHDRYGRTTQCTNGALTHRVSLTGVLMMDPVDFTVKEQLPGPSRATDT